MVAAYTGIIAFMGCNSSTQHNNHRINTTSVNFSSNTDTSSNITQMKRAADFLKLHKDVALATIDKDGNPAIRFFQVMRIDEDAKTLYFATSPQKEVYKQLQNNPNIEILCLADNISVRISGSVKFDVSDEICQKIFNDNSVLPRLYKRYTDLAYFSLPIKKVDYFDLNPTPPKLESFTFR